MVKVEPGNGGGRCCNLPTRAERERRFAKLGPAEDANAEDANAEDAGAGAGGAEITVAICSVSTYYNVFSAPGICFSFKIKNKTWYKSQKNTI
jgi:hypothetical protein